MLDADLLKGVVFPVAGAHQHLVKVDDAGDAALTYFVILSEILLDLFLHGRDSHPSHLHAHTLAQYQLVPPHQGLDVPPRGLELLQPLAELCITQDTALLDHLFLYHQCLTPQVLGIHRLQQLSLLPPEFQQQFFNLWVVGLLLLWKLAFLLAEIILYALLVPLSEGPLLDHILPGDH